MRIGIIGGSSQVGSSVAFYLKNYLGVDVKCFVRSSYSQLFFDILSIPYEEINIHDTDSLKIKLKGCTTVVDFSYPTGQLQDIPRAIETILTNIISSMEPGSCFIYISSIMAFGMDADEKYITNNFFSYSTYSYIKRRVESKCLALGKLFFVNAYNFRLGQVHGFLQSVNSSFREKLQLNKVAFIDGNRNELTNTIFISTVAEAILNYSKDKYSPGTYTLISNPQWTLQQLYEYYIEFYNIQVILEFIPRASSISTKNFSSKVFTKLKRYRPILETYILLRFPKLAIKIKGKFRQNEMKNVINSLTTKIHYIDYNLLGSPPGKVVTGISSKYEEIFKIEKKMELEYTELILSKRV